jgi:hypothetical protein
MPFAVPKLEPEWVHLQEAAARVVEREPSLDIDQVREALRDAIAFGRLRVQSDDDPNDALTWTAFRARQRGFIGSPFAETWRIWSENGAVISWEAGLIFVTIAGKVQPIRLPRVRLAEVFDLFEVPEEKPAPEEAASRSIGEMTPAEEIPVEEGPPQQAQTQEEPTAADTAEKPLTARADLNRWFKARVDEWPEDQDPPSRDADLIAAREKFPGVSPLWVREARRDLAPEKWKKKGENAGAIIPQ